MNEIGAIILAGGLGTRLRSVVADRPKVLAPVAGRPFLTYLLDQLDDAGVRLVVLSTGHLAGQFTQELGKSYQNLQIEYAHEESPLGTGGAIKLAGGFVDAPHLLVMNGDSYIAADLAEYFDWHCRGRHDASLLLASVPDAARFATVTLDAESNVTEFVEKRSAPSPGLINAGVYLLRREMLEHIPVGTCSIERDVLPRWLSRFRVKGRVAHGQFIDIGVPEDYQRSHEFIARATAGRRAAAPTVFLDRDGTINRDVHHLSDPAQLELLPGAAEGLRRLCEQGCRLIVISNQSPIGRGWFGEDRLREIHVRLGEMLAQQGVSISGWYSCPHTPEDGCACRKPAPGLLLRARQEMGVILESSWVVGDRLSDMQAGRAAGARTILVATGYGKNEFELPERASCVDHFVLSLREAADVILNA